MVFHLHETFPKPKRTIKEPPYRLKESGYAGFDIIIDVHLKTGKNEPKRFFQMMYSLYLDPAVNDFKQHTEVINNPSEELRKRLIKGGGVSI